MTYLSPKAYHVSASGYYNPDPPRLTWPEAKRELTRQAKDEAARCRAKFGTAHVHPFPNGYTITLGAEPGSSLWVALVIRES